MSEAEARLLRTFERIHALRQPPHRVIGKSAAIAGVFLLLAAMGTQIWPGGNRLFCPAPWWIFIAAVFFSRWIGGDMAGWIAAVGGVSYAALDAFETNGPEYMVARALTLAAVAGARSRSAWYLPRSPKISPQRLPGLLNVATQLKRL